MKAEDFDRKFDEGENVLKHPDLSRANFDGLVKSHGSIYRWRCKRD